MRIGGSLFLIAVGAILKFAVTKTVSGVSVQTVGVILMIVGLAWLLFELFWWTYRRDTRVVTRTTAVPYAAPVVQPVTPVVQPGVVQQPGVVPPVVGRATYVERPDPYIEPY